MLNKTSSVLTLIACFGVLWLGLNDCVAQNSNAVLHQIFRDKAELAESDLTALDQGETLIKVLPARDKREIAMGGAVRVQASAESFLQSFRENITRKSSPAILEIGSFGDSPSLDDLQGLTIESRDIEDLRQCVVGNCRLKLSAMMINRSQREINWEAPDYRDQVTQLLKQMLVDYVRDYLTRGDRALIQYDDKGEPISLADEQHELLASSGYHALADTNGEADNPSKSEAILVDNAFIWSKIKFGLKPVIAVNHIMIYQRPQNIGAQILIVSQQIYANHYFDSSLGLTAFINIPGPTPKTYLLYENRSRVDGLGGVFGKVKRGIIEDKAVSSLESILQRSQRSLDARAPNPGDSSQAPFGVERKWPRWRVSRLEIFVLVLAITVFAVLLGLRGYAWKGYQPSHKPLKLNRALELKDRA